MFGEPGGKKDTKTLWTITLIGTLWPCFDCNRQGGILPNGKRGCAADAAAAGL